MYTCGLPHFVLVSSGLRSGTTALKSGDSLRARDVMPLRPPKVQVPERFNQMVDSVLLLDLAELDEGV